MINIIFLSLYGAKYFETVLIAKLDYVLFSFFIIIFIFTISELFKRLLKYDTFKTVIDAIINSVIVIISSILSLSLYLLWLSITTDRQEIIILFSSLIGVLVIAVFTLVFIDKKIEQVVNYNKDNPS